MNEFFSNIASYAGKIVALILVLGVIGGFVILGVWYYHKLNPNGPKIPEIISNPTIYKPGTATSTADQPALKVNHEKLENLINSNTDIIADYYKQ